MTPKNNWKSTFKEILIPVLSLLVALAGIAGGVFIQRSTTQSQIEMKRYEITSINNQKNYAEFMKYLSQSFNNMMNHNRYAYTESMSQVVFNYHLMEPFLDESSRALVWGKLSDFANFCYQNEYNYPSNEILSEYREYEDFFRNILCNQLFSTIPSPK